MLQPFPVFQIPILNRDLHQMILLCLNLASKPGNSYEQKVPGLDLLYKPVPFLLLNFPSKLPFQDRRVSLAVNENSNALTS